MVRPGDSIERSRAVAESLRLQAAHEIKEVADAFGGTDTLNDEGQYQDELFLTEGLKPFIAKPLSETFSTRYASVIHLLTHNTTRYDPDIEAMIKEDHIVSEMRSRIKEAGMRSENYSRALCARRTIVVAVAAISIKNTEPAPQAENPSLT